MISTVEKVLFLKQVELFRQIPGAELARIARITHEVTFSPGETIIVENDIGDAAFLILGGEVKVESGGKNIATLSKNQVVGEMAILDSEPRSATVTAINSVHTLVIEREDFYDIMHERHEIAQGIIKVLTQRLRTLLNPSKNEVE